MDRAMSHDAPVSVIVPCYRAAATIARAVESVAAQTVVPAEVILVDDASPDATADAIDRLSGRSWPFALRTTRLVENRGPSDARNLGWQLAAPGSRYVAFLDADDVWLPGKLERQIAWMETHEDVAWTAHRIGILGRATVSEAPAVMAAVPITRTGLLARNTVPMPTVVVRSTVPGRFRPGWRRCEDLMLWIDWLDEGERGMMLEATLALLGRTPATPGGATGDLPAMYAGERRVIDALASEHRLSALAAMAWRGYAWARYQRRRAIA
jgi:glycosyltransferase involved in cell wall biosynthesis